MGYTAADMAFADMKEEIRHREQETRKRITGRTRGDTFTVRHDHVYTKESRALNRILGLNKLNYQKVENISTYM